MIRFWEMEWLEEQLADTHLRDNMVYKIMQVWLIHTKSELNKGWVVKDRECEKKGKIQRKIERDSKWEKHSETEREIVR